MELVSEETTILFELQSGDEYGVWYEAYDGLAVDPATYRATRDLEVTAGDLADLSGPAIAVSPSVALGGDWQVGEARQIRLDGQEHEVRIAALLPGTVSGPTCSATRTPPIRLVASRE